jgi:hypothetical protein
MTPEVRKLITEQIQKTSKALTAQLVARSKREPSPQEFIFTALGRLNELSPVDGDINALEAGLNTFAKEYGLVVPSFAESDELTRQPGWVQ